MIVRPGWWLSDKVLYRIVDMGVIDGALVNGSGRTLGILGSLLRLLQNGLLRWYTYAFAFGALMILFYLLRHVQ